ncbi:MAG TPA: zinc-ribbon domain-containing protein, partial [Pirellulaceae bacterium]|nr:zinc-ribbon domain-containing protein [Pirellulaceae bacterium]
MKIFHCDHCQNLVFFENIRCLRCDHALAYLPDVRDLGSLDSAGQELWRSPVGMGGRTYRLCENYSRENVCNWAVPADDSHSLCQSCRLTRVIPDLTQTGNKEAWYRLEVAKRRLVYSLIALSLPVQNKDD